MSAIALVTAGLVVACGAFGSDPGTAPPAGEDAAAASDGSAAEDAPAVTDGGGADGGCHLLLGEDFNPPGAAGFTDTAANNGTLTPDSTQWTSPPSSLLAEGTVINNAPLRATKEREIALRAGGLAAGPLQLDFDVYLEKTSNLYEEVGCMIELRDSVAARTRLSFARTVGGALLLSAGPDADGGTQGVVLGSYATLGWHHVHGFVVLVDPSHVAVQYAVAPDSVPVQPNAIPVGTSAAVDRVRVVCGTVFANTNADASIPVSVFVDSLRVQQCVP